jgi:hypothetical protein
MLCSTTALQARPCASRGCCMRCLPRALTRASRGVAAASLAATGAPGSGFAVSAALASLARARRLAALALAQHRGASRGCAPWHAARYTPQRADSKARFVLVSPLFPACAGCGALLPRAAAAAVAAAAAPRPARCAASAGDAGGGKPGALLSERTPAAPSPHAPLPPRLAAGSALMKWVKCVPCRRCIAAAQHATLIMKRGRAPFSHSL